MDDSFDSDCSTSPSTEMEEIPSDPGSLDDSIDSDCSTSPSTAMGKIGKFIGAEHASIYIGGGASVHLYNDGKARLICTSVNKSASYQCEMLILDPDKNQGFFSRIEIIKRAVTAFCEQNSKKLQGQYAAMTNNCHQWVFDIAKKDALHRIQGIPQNLVV